MFHGKASISGLDKVFWFGRLLCLITFIIVPSSFSVIVNADSSLVSQQFCFVLISS